MKPTQGLQLTNSPKTNDLLSMPPEIVSLIFQHVFAVEEPSSFSHLLTLSKTFYPILRTISFSNMNLLAHIYPKFTSVLRSNDDLATALQHLTVRLVKGNMLARDVRDLDELPLLTRNVLRTLVWPAVQSSQRITDWSIPVFPKLQFLAISGLAQGNILDLVPSFWSGFPALKTLIIQSSNKGPLWISFHETEAPELTKLVLDTRGGEEARLYSLPPLQQSLRCLSLRQSTISDNVDLGSILSSLSSLRELTLLDISRPVDVQLPNLTVLHLEGQTSQEIWALRTTWLWNIFPKLPKFRALQSLKLERLIMYMSPDTAPLEFSLNCLHLASCYLDVSTDLLFATTRDLYICPSNFLPWVPFNHPFPKLVALEHRGAFEDLKPFEAAATNLQALSSVHTFPTTRYFDEELCINFPALRKLSLRATLSKDRFDLLQALVRDVEKGKFPKLENIELWFTDDELNLESTNRNDLIQRLEKARPGLSVNCLDFVKDSASGKWNSWKADVLRI
ncbi:hypothetical protein BT69DRAFT_1285650, partial [Atractiella rhizophila]